LFLFVDTIDRESEKDKQYSTMGLGIKHGDMVYNIYVIYLWIKYSFGVYTLYI
jgi:hypothetical protein